jgi:hypothetical protein
MKDRVLKIAFLVITVAAIFEGIVLILLISRPFPPEQVYYQVPSQDGKWIALFSVKHQGIISWIPEDIEPHYYLTLVDRKYGRVCIRKSVFRGDMKASFAELARQDAPWATPQLSPD